MGRSALRAAKPKHLQLLAFASMLTYNDIMLEIHCGFFVSSRSTARMKGDFNFRGVAQLFRDNLQRVTNQFVIPFIY